jgi:glycosyltransferase involved in cell wall biosynthesis
MPPAPRVSVLIAAYRSVETIEHTLDALRAQTRAPHQVIVVESGDDGTAERLAGRAEVELLRSPRRLHPGAARNRGLSRVSGDVVACLDADCVPDCDWIERVASSMADGTPALAGAVLNARDSDSLGWAYFLSEFAPWLPGAPRALADAPTCNTAYRRGLIESVGGFTEAPLLSADSLLHWTLRARLGVSLRFEPRMRVRHRYVGSARAFLARRFEHGRSLGRARRMFRRSGPAPRAARALAALALLPAFYALRLLRLAPGHPDVPWTAFVRALPLTLAGLTLWAWGQADGLLRPMRGPAGAAAPAYERDPHGSPGPQPAP